MSFGDPLGKNSKILIDRQSAGTTLENWIAGSHFLHRSEERLLPFFRDEYVLWSGTSLLNQISVRVRYKWRNLPT